MAADAVRQRLQDLLPAERTARVSRHVHHESEGWQVVDDLSDDSLALAHTRGQKLAAEVRDSDVTFLDRHESEELRRGQDRAETVDVHVDFPRDGLSVSDPADLIDGLNESENLPHGHLRHRTQGSHRVLRSNIVPDI